jgi:hypothetical protein
LSKRAVLSILTHSRPAERSSIAEIKSSKADTFETIAGLDGGLGEDNKIVFTTTWQLYCKNDRVDYIGGMCDNGLQVDAVLS